MSVTHRGPKRKPVAGGFAAWAGRFVEARCGTGATYRGTLRTAGHDWLVLESLGGREVLIPCDKITALLDQNGPASQILGDDELLLDAEDA